MNQQSSQLISNKPIDALLIEGSPKIVNVIGLKTLVEILGDVLLEEQAVVLVKDLEQRKDLLVNVLGLEVGIGHALLGDDDEANQARELRDNIRGFLMTQHGTNSVASLIEVRVVEPHDRRALGVSGASTRRDGPCLHHSLARHNVIAHSVGVHVRLVDIGGAYRTSSH
jgi:hypothetical protein